MYTDMTELLFLLVLVLVLVLVLAEGGSSGEREEDVVVPLSVVGGIACPYSAAWMADVDLFMKAKIFLTEPKMEEATFAVYRKVSNLYQVTNFKDFYILHMSAFEHGVSKLEGFSVAEEKTNTFTESTLERHCANIDQMSFNFSSSPTTSIAFIPFYSKRPAGTVLKQETNKMIVTTIGQGNSLVSPAIKVKQLLSTLCSVLKYFEFIIVGVTDKSEQNLVQSTILKYLPSQALIWSRIATKIFSIPKPALLPFYLLYMGQWFVKQHNCDKVANADARQQDLYCTNKLWHNTFREVNTLGRFPTVDGNMMQVTKHISHVYYSESDSVLIPKSLNIMKSLIQALSASTIIAPVRVEKNPKSSADLSQSLSWDILTEDLSLARNPCGKPLCTLQQSFSLRAIKTKPEIVCRKNFSESIQPSRKGRGFVDVSDNIYSAYSKGRSGDKLHKLKRGSSAAVKIKYMQHIQKESLAALESSLI